VQLLPEGIEQLARFAPDEVPAFRIVLGRAHWETGSSERALREYELAYEALEPLGPSADLAVALLRISGMHSFAFEHAEARDAAERAVAVAEAAGATSERTWALAFLAIALVGLGDPERALELSAASFDEAVANGWSHTAVNIVHNEVWTRAHLPIGGLDVALERLERCPFHPLQIGLFELCRAWAALASGDPRVALEQAEASLGLFGGRIQKFEWRAKVVMADALLELDRPDEAAAVLPARSTGAEVQDLVYECAARIGIALRLGRIDDATAVGDEIAASAQLRYPTPVGVAVEALLAGGRDDVAEAVIAGAGPWAASGPVREASARLALARGDSAAAAELAGRAVEQAEAVGLVRWARRARLLHAEALAAAGDEIGTQAVLQRLVDDAAAAGAARFVREGSALAGRLGLDVAPAAGADAAAAPELLPLGERLVTSLFADVRGYTGLAQTTAPAANAEALATLHRLAVTEVGRRHGIVDKFAGDAVMATFNATGARLDHTELAAEAALALRDKAALLDIPIGIGIAVGPAVVGRAVAGANVSVLGSTTNLAARLQAAAGTGEIVLAEEAHRRLNGWLAERGLTARDDLLELKGFAEPQRAYRLAAR
jgi:class 3 adenylate cyclase